MGDIKPNLTLRKMQIQVKISELNLNLQRMDLRKMELDDEKNKIDVNMDATNKALAELQIQLGE
jgi:hypothetical protein